DSECEGGDLSDPTHRCVPMMFEGEPRDGGYCLRRVASTCPARIYRLSLTATSLSGEPAEQYCSIAQENSCEAVRDLSINGATCPSGQPGDCGCVRNDDGICVTDATGGLCETVGVEPNRCTYTCGAPDQCPPTFTCSQEGYCE